MVQNKEARFFMAHGVQTQHRSACHGLYTTTTTTTTNVLWPLGLCLELPGLAGTRKVKPKTNHDLLGKT